MKTFATSVLLLGLLGATALAQETKTNAPVRITANEAQHHMEADAIVTGKVVEVNHTARVTYLNFEKPFPNATFTAVIFATKTNLFPEVDKFKDQTVEVTGKIARYRNQPEIVLSNTNQIRIVESGTGTAPAERK